MQLSKWKQSYILPMLNTRCNKEKKFAEMHIDNFELQPQISIRSFTKLETFKNKMALSASTWHKFPRESKEHSILF